MDSSTALNIDKGLTSFRNHKHVYKMATIFVEHTLNDITKFVQSEFVNLTSCLRQNLPLEHSEDKQVMCAVVSNNESCCYCGVGQHLRKSCPASKLSCGYCFKRGHLESVCMKKKSCVATMVPCLSKSTTVIRVNDVLLNALIDTGSSDSFISERKARELNLELLPYVINLSLASGNCQAQTIGKVIVSLKMQGHVYESFTLGVISNLCSDVLIGHDLLSEHNNLKIQFKGKRSDLKLSKEFEDNQPVCNVIQAKLKPVSLFSNMSTDCRPIACKSRRYSEEDLHFISNEVEKLLAEGTIEPSHSPWRAQVLVVQETENHRKRLVVDYSRTVNKYTELDAYPLPNIEFLAQKVSQYRIFSTLDLKSAYHQLPILEHERPFTAFEANGRLFQFTSIPFGVTNGVSAFQREMDRLVDVHKLQGTFPYMDNITIGGMDQAEHDINLQRFYEVVKKYRLTLNTNKSIISVSEVNMLGFKISFGIMRPDPDRMKPLLDLPYPHDMKSLKRSIGLFSYYSPWVPQYSKKLQPLVNSDSFPLLNAARIAFDDIKQCIIDAELTVPNAVDLLVVETDASDSTLSATLNQNGQPVAFFSRTLNNHERNHSSVEKEAAAIVESCRKWRHYLHYRKFLLITDQKSVSFIFDGKNKGKIKNDKLMRWRIELSCLDYDIRYRPGEENSVADCLSRAHCASIAGNKRLLELHEGLCHPGVTRLSHYVRTKNLPYSMADIKSVISQCRICAVIKPNFFRPSNPPLIKATQPLERLSIDFKGPVPSCTNNKYLFVAVDEYSRFPFIFPCKDMTAPTIIKCLQEIFALFGMAGYIHSDNGPSLVSKELQDALFKLGIPCSNSSVYNPRGNGQVERFNATIWKSILLALQTRKLQDNQWELVIPAVLHSLRSLVCVATNETPHERLFNYQRRSMMGHSLPTWLHEKGSVLLRRHNRRSKYDPIVDEVELLQATPTYARVRLPTGHEQTVSLRDLAPLPASNTDEPQPNLNEQSANVNVDAGVDCHIPETPKPSGIKTMLPEIDFQKFTKNVFNRNSADIAVDVGEQPHVETGSTDQSGVSGQYQSRYGRTVNKPEILNYSIKGGINR